MGKSKTRREETMIDCISLWNPWAQWVALGWKTIETRRHNKLACLSQRGKRIVIHAADKWDKEWWIKSREFITSDRRQITMAQKDIWPRGALICTVEVEFATWVNDVPASKELREVRERWSEAALCDIRGLHVLGLSNVQRFTPIPWSGHQGIMKIPDEVIAKRGDRCQGKEERSENRKP